MWQEVNLEVRGFEKEMKEEEGIEEGWKSYRRIEMFKGMRDSREMWFMQCVERKKKWYEWEG